MPNLVSALERVANIAQIWDTPAWLLLVLLLWALSGVPRAKQMNKQGQSVKPSWWGSTKRAYSKAPRLQRIEIGIVATAAILMTAFNVANSYGFKDWIIRNNLTEVEDKSFFSQEVPLDGYSYRHCEFNNVTLVYNGSPFRITDSKIGRIHLYSKDKAIRQTFVLLNDFGMLKVAEYDANGKPVHPFGKDPTFIPFINGNHQ
jgi:hypothetical protein